MKISQEPKSLVAEENRLELPFSSRAMSAAVKISPASSVCRDATPCFLGLRRLAPSLLTFLLSLFQYRHEHV